MVIGSGQVRSGQVRIQFCSTRLRSRRIDGSCGSCGSCGRMEEEILT